MTPNEIHNKQFDKAMSGYRPDDVNAYLEQVADYVEELIEEKSVLDQKIMVLAEKLEEYREDEDSLRAALIGAQKLGDSVVRESKRKAEQILAEAQTKADLMVADIRHNIDRETGTLNKMQAEVARFKSQILAMYRQHIESINSIPYDEKNFPSPKQAAPSPPEPPEPQEPKEQAESISQKKDFVVTFEDESFYVEVPDESTRRESRHGDLLFGEKYPLTRKD